ncbi:MAG: SRPBCC family protein [Gemmatimonadota bacterium]
MAPKSLTKLVPPLNVGYGERWMSVAAGIGLIAFGLNSRRFRRVLIPAGGVLVLRGLIGRSSLNQMLGRNGAPMRETDSPVASVHRGEGIRVDKTITINRPAEELYSFWRNFENLPSFMGHLESVKVLDSLRSHWVVKGPAATHFAWDAEIHNEIPGKLIAWRSLGGDVNHAGSVHFRPNQDGQGTDVRVEMLYEPPAGKVGAAIAKLFGEEPAGQVADDLRRFKAAMES